MHTNRRVLSIFGFCILLLGAALTTPSDVANTFAATSSTLTWTSLGSFAAGEDGIVRLVATPGGHIVGGTSRPGGPGKVFRYAISTGTATNLLALPGSGNFIGAMTPGPNNQVYIAHSRAYGQGNLVQYDASANSVTDRGSFGDEYGMGITVGPDGKVFINTCCQGKISVFDPETSSWSSHLPFYSQQRRLSALTTGEGGKIYGTTSRFWQPPLGDARLFVHDEALNQSALIGLLAAGNHESWNIGHNPFDGKIYGTVSHDMVPQLWTYDPYNPSAGITTIGPIGTVVADIYNGRMTIAPDGVIYIKAGSNLYKYDPARSPSSIEDLGLNEGGGGPMTFGSDGRLYSVNGTQLMRSDTIRGNMCEEAIATKKPILLVTGWGGSEEKTIDSDKQLRYFVDWLAPHGYRLGCNLFYASGTSPYKTLEQNGVVIRDELCKFALRVQYSIPNWAGSFDIIAHSYGGLRSRAFLENGALYNHFDSGQPSRINGVACNGIKNPVKVENLFTLGTPHNGETGTLPLASIIGARALFGIQRPALMEMLPNVAVNRNGRQSQAKGVHYYLIAGQHQLQPQALLLDLSFLSNWPFTESLLLPNDLAVHTYSAWGLSSSSYPNVTKILTPDVHGDLHSELSILDPSHALRSYVYPETTFETELCPSIGLSNCQAVSYGIDKQTQAPTATHMLALQQQPQETEAGSVMILASDILEGGSSITGEFDLVGNGTTVIYLTWTDGALTLQLTDPQGNVITSGSATTDPNIDYTELDTGFGMMAYYQIGNSEAGTWSYSITSGPTGQLIGYQLMVSPAIDIAIIGSSPEWIPNGSVASLSATVVFDSTTPVIGGTVMAEILRPDETVETITLFDDGNHQDGDADDGVFGADYTNTSLGGFYHILFTAMGEFSGNAYTRSANDGLSVAPATASLTSVYDEIVHDIDMDLFYESLTIAVGVDAAESHALSVSADLFSGDTLITHTFTKVDSVTESIPITFDGQAIYESGLNGPYAIRNLILFDESQATLAIEAVDNAYLSNPYTHLDFAPDIGTEIAMAEGNAELTWLHPSNRIDHYAIFRSTQPYFNITDASVTKLAETAPPSPDSQATFLDTTVSTLPVGGYFYKIVPYTVGGIAYPGSREVGYFKMALERGDN